MTHQAFAVVPYALVLALTSGCSVYMAARQPEAKDLSVLFPGTPRSRVIAALGGPVRSETRNGVQVDTFTFTQGYSRVAKAARALVHGAADFMTFGLWEVIGTPIEIFASGTVMHVEVTYDERDRVKTVVGDGRSAETRAGALAE